MNERDNFTFLKSIHGFVHSLAFHKEITLENNFIRIDNCTHNYSVLIFIALG